MDFSKAAMLLHVADKARQWPNLKKLESAALAELEAIQAEDEKPKAVPAARHEPSTADVPRRMIQPTTGDA